MKNKIANLFILAKLSENTNIRIRSFEIDAPKKFIEIINMASPSPTKDAIKFEFNSKDLSKYPPEVKSSLLEKLDALKMKWHQDPHFPKKDFRTVITEIFKALVQHIKKEDFSMKKNRVSLLGEKDKLKTFSVTGPNVKISFGEQYIQADFKDHLLVSMYSDDMFSHDHDKAHYRYVQN